jgi:hypothetical protein
MLARYVAVCAAALVVLLSIRIAAAQAAPPPSAPPSALPTPTPSPSSPAPAATAPTAPIADETREEARSHFDLAISHFDREEWEAALVEFLRSRQLLPLKGNTKNAAICLRKVSRFDESLEMFESLLRDFPDLSPTDRELAQREVTELQASVGTIEIRDAPGGATVTVDAVERGKTPLPAPLRLSAGSHSVRVTRDGSLPFEARVDLVGRQAAVLSARLVALTQAGRLRVTERDGKPMQIVVDGAVVGTTPWEGALAPGRHTLLSRGLGEAGTGTQPESVEVALDNVATVELVAAPLRAGLRVVAKPDEAVISVDDVPVGHASWEGALRSGQHRVGVSSQGYVPFHQGVVLVDDARQNVETTLAPIATTQSHLALEADVGMPLGLVWGGEIRSDCTGTCSAGVPVGLDGQLHAIYQMPSGFGLGIQAGYLMTHASSARGTTVTPVGLPADSGSTTDTLWLQGVMLGAEAQYVVPSSWPVTLRLGAGALLGSIQDNRSGTFEDSARASFDVASSQKPSADYVYVGPEMRIGRRLGQHIEVSAGVRALVLFAVKTPTWSPLSSLVPAGADGEGTFPSASLSGGVMVMAIPSLGLKYEL